MVIFRCIICLGYHREVEGVSVGEPLRLPILQVYVLGEGTSLFASRIPMHCL
jgi:hypothetical protein